MTGRNRAVYMISVVADMFDVHPQTLRLYERQGFIRPGRSDGGVRLYSQEDVDRIKTVLNLTREMGVNLAGVEVILSMREKMQTLQDEMEDMAERMRQEFRAELARRESMLQPPLVKKNRG